MISSFALQVSLAASEKAASLTPPTDPWSLIQYGILGVIAACLITRKGIVPEWVLKRDEVKHAEELAARDARITGLEGQVARLQAVFQDQMIPALTRSTEVQAKYNEELAHQRWAQGDKP